MAQKPDDAEMATKLIVMAAVLLGLLLITISLLFPHIGEWGYVGELLKELGIVVLAVFVTSFLYEVSVAKRYHQQFLRSLQSQIKQGESNAAACAQLGIQNIFATRNKFEQEYSLRQLVSRMDKDSSLRVVAKSGILLMGNSAVIKEAIEKGVAIELCLFDPSVQHTDPGRVFKAMKSDVETSIGILRSDIIDLLEDTNKPYHPAGSLIVKLHQVILSDSFLQASSEETDFCVWDVSFGRSLSDKRIFLLNPKEGLGENLANRYQKIWLDAQKTFEYSNQQIEQKWSSQEKQPSP